MFEQEERQLYCDHCNRELRNGERVLVWAPMEEIGEPEPQQIVCDVCEQNLAAQLDRLLGD